MVVDVQTEAPQVGDIYMLCSDGLTGELTDPVVEKIMNSHGDDVTAMTKDLVQQACDHGGKDNITAICVRIDEV